MNFLAATLVSAASMAGLYCCTRPNPEEEYITLEENPGYARVDRIRGQIIRVLSSSVAGGSLGTMTFTLMEGATVGPIPALFLIGGLVFLGIGYLNERRICRCPHFCADHREPDAGALTVSGDQGP